MFSPFLYPLLIFLISYINHTFAFDIKLECDGPIVVGATLNCTTWVLVEDDNEKFKYEWRDDAIPPNHKLTESGSSIDTWQVTYGSNNHAGGYIIRVDVCKWYLGLFCNSDTSAGTFFYLTDSLNGQITLSQGNDTRNTYVSTATTLRNNVTLKPSDQNYIAKAPSLLSYWFVDCVYYGITNDLHFDYNFTKPDEDHMIESLVVADFTPLPPPTTTTLKPSTSTTKSTTTKATTTVTTTTHKPKSKRDVGVISKVAIPFKNNSSANESQSNIKVWQNGTLVPYNGTFPYVCNSTMITTDSTKVYGYFQKIVTTKAAISNVTISGNNWLQYGELLTLNVNCKGSAKMEFCVYFKPGLYNVTGNETCSEYDELEKCDFPIHRYFQDEHTVIIIIKNDVSKKVSSVAVTIYKVKQQAQLSVIVVPVVFSLVAVVTIVFGVAYYLQNRSRFIVEVADFDFGQKYADMEYKTFRDRLKDSIVNAFVRPSSSDDPIWPPGQQYGSMK